MGARKRRLRRSQHHFRNQNKDKEIGKFFYFENGFCLIIGEPANPEPEVNNQAEKAMIDCVIFRVQRCDNDINNKKKKYRRSGKPKVNLSLANNKIEHEWK